MSGFRDTFTKDDKQDEALSYDDTAFYYFASSVIVVFLVPWTYTVVRNLLFGESESKAEVPGARKAGSTVTYCKSSEMVEQERMARKQEAAAKGGSPLVRYGLLALLWIVFLYCVTQVSGAATEIKKFDPFDILEVSTSANDKEIKKAYRKLSLVYHPDKNPDDPLAASHFIRITKAYAALTDEVARRNWEKYGNPDGPQTSKVGIGLPRFLLEKEHNMYILIGFFGVLIIAVPLTFICYYQRTKNFAANGVLIETLHFLGEYVTEFTRTKACPELLAACAESRVMPTRPTDNEQIQKLAGHVVEHKKRSFTLPAVMKNQFLVWAHMQRRHGLMSEELRADLDAVLCHAMKVTQAMIEIACMREWFATANAMLDFRRCLVQALDIKSSQLLQIPHFREETVQQCQSGRHPVTTLAEFLALDAAQRKEVLAAAKFEPSQVADVDAFCSHIGEIEVKAWIKVEDEEEILVGDVATVTVQMLRKHVDRTEAMGPVHAPLFPEAKSEEWWFFLVEEEASKRIVHFERSLDPGRFIEEKLRFQVARAGVNSLTLHAMCDSYAGIDRKVELNYLAYGEDEVKRELPLHEEDEALDMQPTLFQQWVGDLGKGDDSEDEEGEEAGEGGGGAKKGKEATNLAGTSKRAAAEASDEEDSSDDGSSGSEEE
mmetsp:Transcript_59000/g.173189  ORF Transcript_59000/g.173189 Transcript_59000/m.173189 type:complete len:660 (+) Transcript_59000:132-2111(+)